MVSELARLRQLVEAVSSFVGTADASGRPLWVNRAGRELCGLGPDDPLPGWIGDFHPRWAAWKVLSEGIAVADREGVWRGETVVLSAGEDEIPVEQVLVAHHDRSGQLEALSTVMRDLRETRQLNADLRMQARLLAAVGEAVIATDAEGRVAYWNAAAERLYGWGAAEAQGQPIEELIVGGVDRERRRELMAALRRGESWSGVIAAADRHGRQFPAQVTHTPVLDEHGRISQVIGVFRDVSDLHVAQHQTQQRARQQAAVAALGRQLLGCQDLDEMLELACQRLMEALEGELCHVLELEVDGEALRLRAGAGETGDAIGDTAVPVRRASLAATVLAGDEPVVVEDVAADGRFDPPPLLTVRGVASTIAVRISLRDRVYGLLSVHNRRRRAYTADDAACVQSVAHLLAAAIEHHDADRALRRLAWHDSLTGLANHAHLVDRLQRWFADGGRGGRTAVLVVNLDRFELVNQALDRSAGDELLVGVGERLRAAASDDAVVARLSADEFGVACRTATGQAAEAVQQARELAARLRDAVCGAYELRRGPVQVSARIGVAVDTGDEEAEELLRNAHTAAAHAQQAGRGRIAAYNHELAEQAAHRLQLTAELANAVASGELALVYQPAIDLRDGTLLAVEALLRWNHPQRGWLTPAAFLDVAENTGLIAEIGAWALQRACHDTAALAAPHPGEHPVVAVNVSAHQTSDPGFVAVVDDALARSGLAEHRLMLELTETAILTHPDVALANLSALHDRGVKMAVDDFGTGYSSLTHLADLPADVVKIDRTFIAGLSHSGRHRQIVQATISLADTLKLTSVAEGVETGEHLALLQSTGCHAGQGHLWSPPQPLGELTRWLAHHPPRTRIHQPG